MRRELIKKFVDDLSKEDTSNFTLPVENIYQNEYIRENLLQYLLYMDEVNPQILLVGEAPGYKGCARTGIPFVDDVELRRPENRKFLGYWKRQELPDEFKYENQEEKSEISASTIFKAFRSIDEDPELTLNEPLMWNAFPFHPYDASKGKASNRTPGREEKVLGKIYLDRLRTEVFSFSVYRTYGVGETAKKMLGIEGNYIRHPAYGGAIDCVKGLTKVLNRNLWEENRFDIMDQNIDQFLKKHFKLSMEQLCKMTSEQKNTIYDDLMSILQDDDDNYDDSLMANYIIMKADWS